jgi:hypothetical protein
MSKEEIVAFLNDMVDALTWKRAGLLTLLGSFVVALLMAFENRSTLFDHVYQQPSVEQLTYPWELSENTRTDLVNLLAQDIVGGVLVTEVNLKKNRRTTKFWAIKDPVFKETAARVVAGLLPQALFDTDRKNNEQMISVLNNQFLCTPTAETTFARILPDMPKKLPYVCRLAVPPYVGEFAGFITIALSRQATASELEALKIELTRISIELYLRDVAQRGLREGKTQ